MLREAEAIPAIGEEDAAPEWIGFRRAVLEGNAAAALGVHEEAGKRSGVIERMEMRWDLWRLTGDRTHLAEAHRLLLLLRDHAPEEDRGRMMKEVPLHRGIAEAAAR
jgi:hypothetical protein